VRAAAAGLLVTLALVGSCARKGPPSGGPLDLEPPRIVSLSPDSGAAGVPRDAQFQITFSEGMEPQSTGQSVDLAPRVEIRQRKWSGHTMTVVLADTLAANRAYTMFVGNTARDRHGNPMREGKSWVFTTAATLPPGVLAGRLEARGFPAGGTYLWCYRQDPPRAPDSTARDFDALGIADRDGHFRVVGLSVPGHYKLWAFADLNGNRSFEPDKDLLTPADTLLSLTTVTPVVEGLALTVVNPRAPARVKGAVLDSLGNLGGQLTVMAVADTDTTRRVLGPVNDRLEFEITLDAGGWSLRAFRDLDRNGVWDRAAEPASDPQPLRLAPAAEITDVQLVLRRPPTPR
jgi:hypothetical protein